MSKSSSTELTFKKSLYITFDFFTIIAIPLIIFGLTGKWLSNKYDNKLYIILGLICALSVTVTWFYIKIFALYKELTEEEKDTKD
ncbi:MAG: hypothetical protein R3B41_02985 [Candidatus Doudnabacteria bacterium]